jgi:hypothetical protein
MAMNFPTNPQDGDTYLEYEYDASIGGWIIPFPQAVDKQYVDDGLATKIPLTEKAQPLGVSTLDDDGQIDILQLAHIVDNASESLNTIGKLSGQFISHTTAEWANITSILPASSVNVEILVDGTIKVKVGDGGKTWQQLNYLVDSLEFSNELQNVNDRIDNFESQKASLSGAVFTGEVNFTEPVLFSGAGVNGVNNTEIGYLEGTASNIQDQLDDKISIASANDTLAPKYSPTFSGTVSLPFDTSIGTVTNSEILALSGVSTSESIQTQINNIETDIATVNSNLDLKAPIDSPTFTGTVAGITKSMVGLSNVDNTSDLDKPISTATEGALELKADITALDLKANIAGQIFTGDIEAPNLVITGDLVVQGTTTSVNTKDYTVRDNMIYMNQAGQFSVTNAVGNGTAVTYTAPGHDYEVGDYIVITGINPSGYNIAGASLLTIDSVSGDDFVVTKSDTGTYVSGGIARGKSAANPDLGFAAGYNDGTYHHAGFFRDASDGTWKVFQNYALEPDLSVFIDTNHASFQLADFQADDVKANSVTFADGSIQTKAGVPSATSFVYKTSSYTLDSLTLADNIIEVDSTSATTITIPLDSVVNYPVGTSIDILQTNTGQVTIAATGGVTLNSTPGLKLRTRWSSATILKRAANTWIAYGDLMA